MVLVIEMIPGEDLLRDLGGPGTTRKPGLVAVRPPQTTQIWVYGGGENSGDGCSVMAFCKPEGGEELKKTTNHLAKRCVFAIGLKTLSSGTWEAF